MKYNLGVCSIILLAVLLPGCASSGGGSPQVNQTGEEGATQISDVVRVNNCGGKADLKQLTKRSRTVTIEGEASIGLTKEVIEAAVVFRYSNIGTIEKTFELTAPPNTNMEFNLVWMEQGWTGTVTEQGQSGQAKYQYRTPLSVEVISQRDLGCSTGVQTPTIASQSPPLNQLPTPYPPTKAASPNPPPLFFNTWVNTNTQTQNIRRLSIQAINGSTQINEYGACEPTDCDWLNDYKPAPVVKTNYDPESGVLNVIWTFNFSVTTQQLSVLPDGRLRVASHDHFTDNSGRLDYDSVEYFTRQ